MDLPVPTSLSTAQIVLMLLASALSGGLILAVINWLVNWLSGRSKAEIIEIHARSVKLETESQTTSAHMLMEAMERIRELVEINSELQEEATESGRRADNFERNLEIERQAHEQLKIASELREHFIQQLEAANKMGIALKNLPAEKKDMDKAS